MIPPAARNLARALIGESELTSAEVAREAQVDLQQARRLWRALGFPPVPDDHPIFTRSDVEMLRSIRDLLEGEVVKPDVLIQLTRVTGQALARIAEAQVAASADQLEQVTVAEGIVRKLDPLLSYAWRRHFLAALWRATTARAGQSGRGTVLVVGFVDLVGFTAASRQLEEHAFLAMMERFEELAYQHIPEHGGRVIKMIGDEIMFVAEAPTDAADIALALLSACKAEPRIPPVRVGLALGPALSWDGDYFGTTVNLASRLVELARPGTVLVSEHLATLLRNKRRFMLRDLSPLVLKGIGRAKVSVLRRPGGAVGSKEKLDDSRLVSFPFPLCTRRWAAAALCRRG